MEMAPVDAITQTGTQGAPQETASASPPEAAKRDLVRRFARWGAAVALSVVVVAGIILYWDHSRHFETTDDAFISARAFPVAPKVSGFITEVPVTDNQHIEDGAVIARIDQRDYRAVLSQARAQLARDRTALEQAQKNFGRFLTLSKTNSIPQQQVDDQGFLVEQTKSVITLDEARVEAAELDLAHTSVNSVGSGHVVSLSAAVGQFVPAGTALAVFVPDETWIVANFKETQLTEMRPGQAVTLAIDAYPNQLISGRVDSIQPGSGTAFSLLPPQNATGNYVKIVQRVPVKIVIDSLPAGIVVGPGMSVVPTVRVDPTPSLFERLTAK